MPSRKRHKRPQEHPDPLVRFGRALKESEARDQADRQRRQAERDEAKRQEQLLIDYAAAVDRANQRLERSIAAVKRAEADRRGVDDAEIEYRSAKADVIELETGERPNWAPAPPLED